LCPRESKRRKIGELKNTIVKIRSKTEGYIRVNDKENYFCNYQKRVDNDLYGQWKVLPNDDGSYSFENQGTKSNALFYDYKIFQPQRFSVWGPKSRFKINRGSWESWKVDKVLYEDKVYTIRKNTHRKRYISKDELSDTSCICKAGEFTFELL